MSVVYCDVVVVECREQGRQACHDDILPPVVAFAVLNLALNHRMCFFVQCETDSPLSLCNGLVGVNRQCWGYRP